MILICVTIISDSVDGVYHEHIITTVKVVNKVVTFDLVGKMASGLVSMGVNKSRLHCIYGYDGSGILVRPVWTIIFVKVLGGYRIIIYHKD